jgi:hypothetical protein
VNHYEKALKDIDKENKNKKTEKEYILKKYLHGGKPLIK